MNRSLFNTQILKLLCIFGLIFVHLNSFSSKQTTDNFKIDDVLNLLNPISKGDKINDADINVFILWTVYIGKLNDENTYEWIKLLNKAKAEGLKINFYLLNCDTQKDWDLEISKVEIKK